ncbi:MAG: protein-glutamate O-methyltransferase [Phycisphaerae bacterium]|nr:protein-glutamate O-methyltransferase [Phycisphaerae bacterium]
MTTDLLGSAELTQREYELFRQLVYAQSGINLGPEKQHLVRARLGKRLRKGGFKSFKDYYDFVLNDKSGQELATLLDAISTNTTHFFREQRHFQLLAKMVEERMAALGGKPWDIRIWSAGCSSGEEPYSIALTVHDLIKNSSKVRLKLLATDLSTKVLSKAKLGVYEAMRLGTLPPGFGKAYFRRYGDRRSALVQVAPHIRELVSFARFNLMQERFPFKHQFDAIFCRNVMIYFDRPTQEALIARFYQHLRPDGLFLIGHSESLNSLKHQYRYVEPASYRK